MIPLLLGELNPFPIMILASSFTSPVFTPYTFKHTVATGWAHWALLSYTEFDFSPESPSFALDHTGSLRRLSVCLDGIMEVSKAVVFLSPPTLHPCRLFFLACIQSLGDNSCRSSKPGTSTALHLLFLWPEDQSGEAVSRGGLCVLVELIPKGCRSFQSQRAGSQ